VTLQDLESQVLQSLSQPYANVGGPVTWPTNADFNQATVDMAINRTLTRLVSDLGDLELLTQTLAFPSVTGQYGYLLQTATGQPATAIGSYATANITFYGVTTVPGGSTPSITIHGTAFTYTVPAGGQSIPQVINGFINLINASILVNDPAAPPAILSPVNQALNSQTTMALMAGSGGTAGNGITIATSGSGGLFMNAPATFSGGTAANQPIRTVRRVFYQALGQLFRLELEPGARLISWQEFNRKTGAGYALPFSFTTWPDYATISPRRDHLYFYGAPSENGDTITVEYCPIITSNTSIPSSNWGYLVNSTDIPLLPEDAQDAIWIGAAAFLNPNSREIANGTLYGKMYKDEVQRIKDNYTRDSAGDALILRPVDDALVTSGYGPFQDLG
jgi:hypothetical protein